MNLEDLSEAQLKALRAKVGDVAKAKIDRVLKGRRGKPKPSEPVHCTRGAEGPVTGLRIVIPWIYATKNDLTGSMQDKIAYSQAITEAREKVAKQVPGPHPVYQGPVAVGVILYPPDRRRDPHNALDPALDALEGAVVRNDRQLNLGYWIPAGIDRTDPRIELEVVSMGYIHWTPPRFYVDSQAAIEARRDVARALSTHGG